MPARSVAAASKASGLATKNDIAHLHHLAITRLLPGTVDAYGRSSVTRSPLPVWVFARFLHDRATAPSRIASLRAL
ncbi:hypothetical protein LRC537489_28180 [Mycobacterium riyadhense]